MFSKYILFFCMAFVLYTTPSAQTARWSRDFRYPATQQFQLSNEQLPEVSLGGISKDSIFNARYAAKLQRTYRVNDSVELNIPVPDFIGVERSVDNWFANLATKQVSADSTYAIWRLKITSQQARALSFRITNIALDSFETLFAYSPASGNHSGAFSSYSVEGTRLYIPSVEGESIVLEYSTPYLQRSPAFFVKSINHYFKEEASGGRTDNNPCYNNVNCTEWDNWCREIRATVRLSVPFLEGGTFGCSGVIITDPQRSFQPYILTAQHCIEDPFFEGDFNSAIDADLDELEVLFNLQSPICNDAVGNDLMRIDGVDWAQISGFWNGFNDVHDLALLKMRDALPVQHNIYYAGWDRSTTIAQLPDDDFTSIGQPGDHDRLKSIAKGDLDLTPFSPMWLGNFDGTGIQSEGSSGGPLLADDRLVIGTLSGGGTATCNNLTGSNFWGKLGKWNWFRDNIAQTTILGQPVSVNAITGIDPILSCQQSLQVNGEMHDAESWRLTNPVIKIQAEEDIVFNSNIAVNQASTTLQLAQSEYLLQAGNTIKWLPGTTIQRGAISRHTISPCIASEGNCGFNYNKNEETTAYVKLEEIPEALSCNVIPNPFTDELRIQLPFRGNETQITMISLSGQVVMNERLLPATTEVIVKVPDINAGIYFLSINCNGETFNRKLTKSNL